MILILLYSWRFLEDSVSKINESVRPNQQTTLLIVNFIAILFKLVPHWYYTSYTNAVSGLINFVEKHYPFKIEIYSKVMRSHIWRIGWLRHQNSIYYNQDLLANQNPRKVSPKCKWFSPEIVLIFVYLKIIHTELEN